jgi:hypothetical protein
MNEPLFDLIVYSYKDGEEEPIDEPFGSLTRKQLIQHLVDLLENPVYFDSFEVSIVPEWMD